MRLNNPQLMFLITLATAAAAVLGFVFCLTLAVKLRRLRKSFIAVTAETETDLAALQETLESLSTRAMDQSRRVAWLESRVRQGKTAPPAVEPAAVAAGDPSMTERRHRVLSLAHRGYDVNTIASMLNDLPGEVEMIIGLSKAA